MTKVVAANWKMHLGPQSALRFFAGFQSAVWGDGAAASEAGAAASGAEAVRVVFFPPSVSLLAAASVARGSLGPHRPVEFGIQNVHWDADGALTGEVSAEMAREAGATYVLVGHSERRHVFGETDDETRRKVAAAVRAGLTPVVCVGERLEERRAGRLGEVLARQLGAVADALPGPGYMVAYEPVWAIGTGETATPDDAARAHAIVREVLAGAGHSGADEVRVLYGGSVGPENAGALMSAPGVDGVLVGGASLDPTSFARIVEAGVDAI